MRDKPELWMFVGPNGSGKSTIVNRFQQEPDFPRNYINADDLKAQTGMSAKEAQIVSNNRLEEHMRNGDTFAFETVGSHESKVEYMKEAKKRGYNVKLFFVCTQDPDINVQRVHARVAKGGHGVPDEKIVSRYHRSLALLQQEFAIADEALVFDNSWERPVVIAQKDKNGKIYTLSNTEEHSDSRWTNMEIEKILGLNENTYLQMPEKTKSTNLDSAERIRVARAKLRNDDVDLLAEREENIRNGVAKYNNDADMSKVEVGKTGDSRTGVATNEHEAVANVQTAIAKQHIIQSRLKQGKNLSM